MPVSVQEKEVMDIVEYRLRGKPAAAIDVWGIAQFLTERAAVPTAEQVVHDDMEWSPSNSALRSTHPVAEDDIALVAAVSRTVGGLVEKGILEEQMKGFYSLSGNR